MRTLLLLIRGVGMTQDALAQASGLSAKHVSQLVSGQVRMSEKTATTLGRELGVPPLVLLVAQWAERNDQWSQDEPQTSSA